MLHGARIIKSVFRIKKINGNETVLLLRVFGGLLTDAKLAVNRLFVTTIQLRSFPDCKELF